MSDSAGAAIVSYFHPPLVFLAGSTTSPSLLATATLRLRFQIVMKMKSDATTGAPLQGLWLWHHSRPWVRLRLGYDRDDMGTEEIQRRSQWDSTCSYP